MTALREVIGTYGVAVICADFPDTIIGARRGSPLIIGVGNNAHFLTSDANAVVPHTKQVVYLNDYDVATVQADSFSVTNMGTGTANIQISQIEYDDEAAEKDDYEHFMLKEIFEQPQTVGNALRGRLDKVVSNQEVVQARKGPVIAIATEGDDTIAAKADDVIFVPRTHELIYPLLLSVPLQLLAYYIAIERGCDVDKPRNLAKSVTVE